MLYVITPEIVDESTVKRFIFSTVQQHPLSIARTVNQEFILSAFKKDSISPSKHYCLLCD